MVLCFETQAFCCSVTLLSGSSRTQLSIERSTRGSSARGSRQNTENTSKLYVGQLAFSVTREELIAHFNTITNGKCIDGRIVMHRDEPTRSRGFGFVTMNSPEAATEALEKADGKPIAGRNVKVDFDDEKKKGGGGYDGRNDNGVGGGYGGINRGGGDRYHEGNGGGGGGGYGGRDYGNDRRNERSGYDNYGDRGGEVSYPERERHEDRGGGFSNQYDNRGGGGGYGGAQRSGYDGGDVQQGGGRGPDQPGSISRQGQRVKAFYKSCLFFLHSLKSLCS